jgi:hypothetical protein
MPPSPSDAWGDNDGVGVRDADTDGDDDAPPPPPPDDGRGLVVAPTDRVGVALREVLPDGVGDVLGVGLGDGALPGG